MVNLVQVPSKIYPDYTNFVKNEIFVGRITTCDLEKCEFHVVKEGTINSILIPSAFNEIWWIPTSYETFYTKAEEGYMRCARLPVESESDQCRYMKVYLLDTGECYEVSMEDIVDDIFFEIPEAIKEIPGLAIKCEKAFEDISLDSDDYTYDLSYLSSKTYQKFTFEVVEVKTDKLVVNVHPYDDTQEEDEVELVLTPIVKPEERVKKSEGIKIEELEILIEEPFSTNDPQIAIQGFETRDDHNICKFYNPEIGGCFKGGRCKQIHKLKTEDYALHDKEEIYIENILNAIRLPSLNLQVKIEITQFLSFNRFLCRYLNLKTMKNKVSLEDFVEIMNKEEEYKSFERFEHFPSMKQLVIVLSCDGQYYRGRVESECDEEEYYNVLLVDFGIVERTALKNMYKWCQRYNYMPFQCIEMEIVNIKPFKNDLLGRALMQKLQELIDESENKLKAVIVENMPDLKCHLLDKKKKDIGEQLIVLGYAEKKIYEPIHQDPYLPG